MVNTTQIQTENKMKNKLRISWVDCPTACDVTLGGTLVARIHPFNEEVQQLIKDGNGMFVAMKKVARATGQACRDLI